MHHGTLPGGTLERSLKEPKGIDIPRRCAVPHQEWRVRRYTARWPSNWTLEGSVCRGSPPLRNREFGPARKLSCVVLPFGERIVVPPNGSGVGRPWRAALRQPALRRALENPVHHALVFLRRRGRVETGKAGAYHVLHPRETQRSRIYPGGAGSRIHGAAHQVIGRYPQHQLLGYHVHTFTSQRVQVHGTLQGAQVHFDVPAIAIEF